MPHAFIKLEQRFEPLIERFHRFLAPRVDPSAMPAAEEPFPFASQRTAMRSAGVRVAGLGLLATPMSRIFRAQESAPRAASPIVPLDFLQGHSCHSRCRQTR